MSTTRRHDGESQEGAAGSGPAAPPALSRRILLGGAASAFALATSGLLLPDWLVEAAAERQGRLGGELGGRHGKNQRGRNDQRHRRLERRREQDRRQRKKDGNDDKPRGDFFSAGIEFRVELTHGRPVNVDLFKVQRCDARDCGNPPIQWEFSGRRTVDLPLRGGFAQTFDARDKRDAVLWIDDRYLVLVENPMFEDPSVKMGYGGAFIDKSKDGWRNGTAAGESKLKEGQSQPPMNIEGYSIQAERLKDGGHYIVLKVAIAAPAP